MKEPLCCRPSVSSLLIVLEGFFRCDVCGYQSYCPSALKKHMASHEAPKFGCREAIQWLFVTLGDFEAHLRNNFLVRSYR